MITAQASPSEDRKAVYRDIVVRTYGNPEHEVGPCGGHILGAQPEESSCFTKRVYDRDTVDSRDPSAPIWPHEGLPLPEETLKRIKKRVVCDKITTNEFDLNQLVRVIYLTKDIGIRQEYVQAVQTLFSEGLVPFWLERGERHRTYWTENHQILWMSSAFLLEPLLDVPEDHTGISQRARLLHWLDLKIDYGFYEFFSTTYYPYTLSALLNLIDFSTDSTIQSKAVMVADRMVAEWMLVTTDSGHTFPSAGRNHPTKYRRDTFTSILWFTLGIGDFNEDRWRDDYLGGFLATSLYDLERLVPMWSPKVDTVLSIGHSRAEHKSVYAILESRTDRALFQWSAGGYLFPETIGDSKYLIDSFNLWKHRLLKDFSPFFRLSMPILPLIAKLVPAQSLGMDVSGADIQIYKNHNSVLTSLVDYIVGARSGQQWPWAATCDDIAVYTQAGVVDNCVQEGNDMGVMNSHLPDVQQAGNVALISYRPARTVRLLAWLLGLLKYTALSTRVALHFPVELFDEVRESEKWILGRRRESYVAVWRHSLRQNDCSNADGEETLACDPYYYSDPSGKTRGQVWAVVVGNNITHVSFDEFESVIAQGEVTEKTSITPLVATRWLTYQTNLRVDGKELSSTLRGFVRGPGRL